jgi:hypothetical protein
MRAAIKKGINGFLDKVFGLKLYSVRAHGREDVTDIVNLENEIKVIFDVGANVVQSISKFIRTFSTAKIFAFEPVSKTYNRLKKGFSKNENVTVG